MRLYGDTAKTYIQVTNSFDRRDFQHLTVTGVTVSEVAQVLKDHFAGNTVGRTRKKRLGAVPAARSA